MTDSAVGTVAALDHPADVGRLSATAAVAALGIVDGDIGTSPL